MARYDAYDDRPRRSGCVGCLTCICLVAALVAATVVFAFRAGIPVEAVAHAIGHRALGKVGFSVPEEDSSRKDSLGYSGAQLPEVQQDVYLQILEGLERLDETVVVLEAAPTDIDPAYRAIMRDHPELFWLDGSCSYTYATIGGFVTVEPGALVPTDQVASIREQIEAAADSFLQSLPADADDYAIARAAYEYVITNTDYALDASYNQSIMSVFLGHSSVCAGYARAYQYLLQRAGVMCAYVEGSILDTGEEHAWNLVRIGGVYAYVDPTWGDPTYSGDTEDLMSTNIIYDYLCLTTDEIQRDRHAFADASAWPTCDSGELDYYRREGLMFDSYDQSVLSWAFWQQEQTGQRYAAFKFATDADYSAARDQLAAGTFLYDDLVTLATNAEGDTLRYGYTTSDTLRILKLYW